MNRNDLIKRLEPYAAGCFSGKVEEWPQLKPLLRDLYSYLISESDRNYPVCPLCGTNIEEIAKNIIQKK